MPVKRRISKRRVSPDAEVEAWATAFATGWDFFGDLKPFGLETYDQIREAAPEAWKRLGRIFLDRRMGDDFNGPNWALEQIGEPETCQ